ncbi:MAG: hypothetical protein WCL28_04590 [bacterium]
MKIITLLLIVGATMTSCDSTQDSKVTTQNLPSNVKPMKETSGGKVAAFLISSSTLEVMSGFASELSVFGIDSNGLPINISDQVTFTVNSKDVEIKPTNSNLTITVKQPGIYSVVINHPQLKTSMNVDVRVRSAELKSLIASIPIVKMIEKQETIFSVDGIYSDGVRRELSTECAVTSERNNLELSVVKAAYGPRYIVKALSEGAGNIDIACGDKKHTLPFEVIKAKLLSITFNQSSSGPLSVPAGTFADLVVVATFDNGITENVSHMVDFFGSEGASESLNFNTLWVDTVQAIRVSARNYDSRSFKLYAKLGGFIAERQILATSATFKSFSFEDIPAVVYAGKETPFKFKIVYSDGRISSDLSQLPVSFSGEGCSMSTRDGTFTCGRSGSTRISVTATNSLGEKVITNAEVNVIFDEPIGFNLVNIPAQIPRGHMMQPRVSVRHVSGSSDLGMDLGVGVRCFSTQGEDPNSAVSAKVYVAGDTRYDYRLIANELGVTYLQCSLRYLFQGNTVDLKTTTRIEVIDTSLQSLKLDFLPGNGRVIGTGNGVVITVSGEYANGQRLPIYACLRHDLVAWSTFNLFAENECLYTYSGFSPSAPSLHERAQVVGIDVSSAKPEFTVSAKFGAVSVLTKITNDYSSVTLPEVVKCQAYTNQIFQNETVQFCLKISGDEIPLKTSDIQITSESYQVVSDGQFRFKKSPIKVKLTKVLPGLTIPVPDFVANSFANYNSEGFYLPAGPISQPGYDEYIQGRGYFRCSNMVTTNWLNCLCRQQGDRYLALPPVASNLRFGPVFMSQKINGEDFPLVLSSWKNFDVSLFDDAFGKPVEGYKTICFR